MSTTLELLAVFGGLALIIWWGSKEDRGRPSPPRREEPGFEDRRWGL